MGEFGRTPKINGAGGPDHWGPVFSVALAGGGVRGGSVYGSSDKLAAYPKDGRVTPAGPARDDLPLSGHPAATRRFTTASAARSRCFRGEPIRQIWVKRGDGRKLADRE